MRVSVDVIAMRVVVIILILVLGGIVGVAQTTAADDDPALIFNRAQDLHEKGDLAGAVKLYEKALALLPEFPEAEYQRAAALSSLGKSAEAIKGYLRAAELRPEWPLPYSAAGGSLVDAGRFEEAKAVLAKALELQPSEPLALTAMADLYIKTKAEKSLVASLLDRIAVLTARSNATSALWSARAALENELGKAEASRLSLQKALSLDPSDKNALLQMSARALLDGDLDHANELAKRLEAIAPGARQIHLIKAEVLSRSGNTAAALKELDSLPSGDAEGADLRGRILAGGESSAAELEKQLAASPNNSALLGRLCTQYRRDDPVKALAYCQRASEAEPNNVNHAIGFGAALVQAKQYGQAVVLLRKLTNFAPDNWTAHANLATALFQLKRWAEARTEYDWLAEKQPTAPGPHLFLGIVHDRLSEFSDALLEYQAYIKLADPVANKADIDKVNLRLPTLEKDIKKAKKN